MARPLLFLTSFSNFRLFEDTYSAGVSRSWAECLCAQRGDQGPPSENPKNGEETYFVPRLSSHSPPHQLYCQHPLWASLSSLPQLDVTPQAPCLVIFLFFSHISKHCFKVLVIFNRLFRGIAGNNGSTLFGNFSVFILCNLFIGLTSQSWCATASCVEIAASLSYFLLSSSWSASFIG